MKFACFALLAALSLSSAFADDFYIERDGRRYYCTEQALPTPPPSIRPISVRCECVDGEPVKLNRIVVLSNGRLEQNTLRTYQSFNINDCYMATIDLQECKL